MCLRQRATLTENILDHSFDRHRHFFSNLKHLSQHTQFYLLCNMCIFLQTLVSIRQHKSEYVTSSRLHNTIRIRNLPRGPVSLYSILPSTVFIPLILNRKNSQKKLLTGKKWKKFNKSSRAEIPLPWADML